MSTSHRLARSMVVAIPAILLVATAAFAHSSNFSATPAGTWSDKPDITNVGVVGDHEDVWDDADVADSDRDEIDDQVGDDNAAGEVEVDEPDAAEHHAQHATPEEPKAETGDNNDDQGDNNDDQGDDNDDQGEVENHDSGPDGEHDGGSDDGGASDDGAGGD